MRYWGSLFRSADSKKTQTFACRYESSNVWGNYPGDNQLTGTYLMNDAIYDEFIAEFEGVHEDNDGVGFLFGYQNLDDHFVAHEINDQWPSPPADGYSGPHQKIRQRSGPCLPTMTAENTNYALLDSDDGDDGLSVNKANYSPYAGNVIMNMALKVEVRRSCVRQFPSETR